MRVPRKKASQVDLLKPVEVITDQTDCFGTEEYNPRSGDCALCADIELCGLKYQEVVERKVKSVTEAKGPFVDSINTAAIDWRKIKDNIVKYQDSDPITIEELVETITKAAGIKDANMALQYARAQMMNLNIVEDDGKLSSEDTSN